MAGSGAELARRVQAAQRASRAESRSVDPAPTVTTTAAPTTQAPLPVQTAAAPPPKVRQQSAPPTTARPRTTTTAKPTTTTRAPAPPRDQPSAGPNGNTEEGKASYYRAAYHADDPWICAHKTLAKGTSVTVTAVSSGKRITCRVGDRGPYVQGRVIDLSEHAFSQLAPTSAGVISVRLSW